MREGPHASGNKPDANLCLASQRGGVAVLASGPDSGSVSPWDSSEVAPSLSLKRCGFLILAAGASALPPSGGAPLALAFCGKGRVEGTPRPAGGGRNVHVSAQ